MQAAGVKPTAEVTSLQASALRPSGQLTISQPGRVQHLTSRILLKSVTRLAILCGFALLNASFPVVSHGQPCGSTDAWSAVVDHGVNSIFTDTRAAMGGTGCGLVVAPDNDILKRFVQDDSPAAMGPDGAKSYRQRFYLDPNNTPLQKARVAVFNTLKPEAPFVTMFLMKVTLVNNTYKAKFWARKDADGKKSKILFPLENGPNVIEIQLTVGNGDGIFRVWVNNDNENSPDHEYLSLNNSDYGGISHIKLGYISANGPVKGSYYIDEVVSRTNSFIGSIDR